MYTYNILKELIRRIKSSLFNKITVKYLINNEQISIELNLTLT